MRFITAAILILTLCVSSLAAQDREYQIKAEFLERFTRFIEWPEDSGNEDAQRQFVMCIIGVDPFGSYLLDLAREVKIRNKEVIVKEISALQEIPACNLLFVSASEKSNLLKILQITGSKPILTIADSPGFGEKGIHINFFESEGFIRFEINRAAVDRSQLRFSSRLLKLGRPVGNDRTLHTP